MLRGCYWAQALTVVGLRLLVLYLQQAACLTQLFLKFKVASGHRQDGRVGLLRSLPYMHAQLLAFLPDLASLTLVGQL